MYRIPSITSLGLTENAGSENAAPNLFRNLSLTRNSSVAEIGERYRLNHAIVVKLYHSYTQFARNVRVVYGR